MANTIKHKRGSGSDPSASDLVAGELAIRTDTGAVFTKKDDGTVAQVTGSSVGGATGVDFNDNVKARFGTGNDLEIYHDGSNSYIKETAGTGNLRIEANDLRLKNGAGNEDYIKCNENAQVELYHNGTKKLETKSDGIDVAGEVQCDSLDVDGAGDISGSLTVDSGTLFVDSSNNRVGVGTTAPDVLLELKAAEPYIQFTDTAAASGYSRIMGTHQGALVLSADESNSVGSSHLRFDVDASERMRIDSSGRLLVALSSSLLSYAGLQIKGDGDTGGHICLAHKTTTPVGGNNIGSLRCTNSAGGIGAIIGVEADADWTAGSSFPSRIIFATTASSASSPTERMRIDSSGRVGIGTTSPNYFLAALASSGSQNIFQAGQTGVSNGYTISSNGSALTHQWYAGSEEAARIDSSGRLLVGTTTANGSMTVNMGTDKNISFSGSVSEVGSVPALQATNTAGSSLASMGFRATDLRFATGSAERLRIDSSGRLLLGTTTEGEVSADNLTVADSGNCGITIRSGTSNHGNIFFSDGTSGNAQYRGYIQYTHSTDSLIIGTAESTRLTINSNGAWGIEGDSNYGTSGQVLTSNGNDSPTWQTVSGGATDVNGLSDGVTNSSGVTIGLGTNALANDDGSGRENTALGYNALNATTSGSDNVAVGHDSLVSNTTGQRNVGVGWKALESCTTGERNTVIGASASSNLTTGSNNTTLGFNAGNTFTGSNNLCLGNSASPSSTSISNEITLGNSSITKLRVPGLSFEIDSSGVDATGHLIATTQIQTGNTGSTEPGAGNTNIGFSARENGRFFASSGGSFSCINRNEAGGVLRFFLSGSHKGIIEVSSGGVSYTSNSDYRLKENVVTLDGAIARVKQLQPKRFNFIEDPGQTVDGFLAHEAQTVVPEAVTGTHNGIETWQADDELPEGVSVGDNKLDSEGNTIPDYQGIDQSKLVPLLTAALQEAIAKIETLESKVAALEAQ